MPFEVGAARSYGRVYAAIRETGRQPHDRFADLVNASIASMNQVPPYARNPADFVGLDSLVRVVAV